METQHFIRDVQRSSLNARLDQHRPMYSRYKSPSVETSLDSDKNLSQKPVSEGFYNRHFEQQQQHQQEPRYMDQSDGGYENARVIHRQERQSRVETVPPKPPRGLVHADRVEKASPSKSSLYRSNSNLDLDRVGVERDVPHTNLGREYGSTSSLDLLAEADNRDKQSFFSIVRNYKSKTDQRSPAPPKIQQLLRGNVDSKHAQRPSTIPLTSPSPVEDQTDSSPPSKQHKKTKAARRSSGQDGPSLFQKLRGMKTDSTEVKSPTDTDEKVRRKVLIHYDTQSLTFRLSDSNKNSIPKRRVTVTGASAASTNVEDNSDQDEDDGDDRSNSLIVSCPFFRNEISIDDGVLPKFTSSMHHIHRFVVEGRRCYKACRQTICNAVAVLDPSLNSLGASGTLLKRHKAFVIEFADYGATYYRHFFSPYEHQNFFGVDDHQGPVAVSLRRESVNIGTNSSGKPDHRYQYRVIVRTSDLVTLRGSVSEDMIPTPSRISSSKGIPAKDVLEFVCPELNLSSLRLGEKRLNDQLMKLDEMGISKSYKVGLLLCRSGQNTEEDMYNNEQSSPAFEEFLGLLGRRVRLKGFEGFRGGLDTRTDSTGTHSLHTVFLDYEIMFHVSTMLPFTPDDRQQLMRKCHVGNDIVTIIFQEPGAIPFSPKTMRSHFQHVFIIVRANHPCTDRTTYQVAVSRSKEVPAFGPPLPEDSIFPKSQEFSDFLLTKVINGENAVHKSERFISMATRTRQEYLRHLAEESVSGTPLEQSKSSKFQSGSGRKKSISQKNKTLLPEYIPKGGSSWQVEVEDPGIGQHMNAVLAIADNMIVLVEEASSNCVLALPCESVIGWTELSTSLRLYYNHGECLVIRVCGSQQAAVEGDVHDIINRLQALTPGAQTSEMTLQRNKQGQLGFHVQAEGIVSEVDPSGPAWAANLRTNCRIVEVGKFKTASLSLDQLIDILRAAQQIRVVTVPPLPDGSLRKGCEECRVVFSSQPHYLLPSSSMEMDTKSVASYKSEQASDRSDSYHTDNQDPLLSNRYGHNTSSDFITPSPRDPDRNLFKEPLPPGRERIKDDFVNKDRRQEQYQHRRERSRDEPNQPRDAADHRQERYYREEKRRVEDKSPRDQYLDISQTEVSFDSYGSRGSNRDLTHEPVIGKDKRPFIASSPRISRAPKPTEALRERSFQEELMRLISPDLPERSFAADRDKAKSEENIHRKNSYETETAAHRLTKEQRLSPRATAGSVLRSSQNSVWRKPQDTSSVPLLDNTSSMEWSHLVDTANRLVEQREPEKPVERPVSRPDKLSVRAVGGTPWRGERQERHGLSKSDNQRIRDLEQDLEEERERRRAVEAENETLRRDNERLQEESAAAAAQLRRFTQWFFSTMDRQ